MAHHGTFAGLVGLLVLSTIAPPARAQCQAGDPCYEGMWSGPWDWSSFIDPDPACDYDEFSHAALISVGTHAGKVLLWRQDLEAGGPCPTDATVETWLFNPSSPDKLIRIDHDPLSSDIFCSGLSWDAAGNLVVVGGNNDPTSSIPNEAYRFKPRTLPLAQYPIGGVGVPWVTAPDAWELIGLMSIERYYPTIILLNRWSLESGGCTDNSVGGTTTIGGPAHLVISGPPAITNEGNEIWEVLDQGETPWPTDCPVIPESMNSSAPHWGGWSGWERYFPKDEFGQPATPGQEFLDSYARAMQLSNGQVVIAGDVITSATPAAGQAYGEWHVIKPPYASHFGLLDEWQLQLTPFNNTFERFYGSAVLIHTNQRSDRLLAFGGGDPQTLLGRNSVQELEVPQGTQAHQGTWRTKQALLHPRVYCNAIVLPTGDVLVEGGSEKFFVPQVVPVPHPELYQIGSSPTSPGGSTLMAQNDNTVPPTARLYHHVSVLLPDARVLVAGGDNFGPNESRYTAEVFSPPYLFDESGQPANQPLIESFPEGDKFSFGQSFSIDVFTSEGLIERVVLIRPAALTHHFDNDQRYIELAMDPDLGPAGSRTITGVVAPPDSLGPPGWYMLFVLERKTTGTLGLVPSVASFVKLKSQ